MITINSYNAICLKRCLKYSITMDATKKVLQNNKSLELRVYADMCWTLVVLEK